MNTNDKVKIYDPSKDELRDLTQDEFDLFLKKAELTGVYRICVMQLATLDQDKLRKVYDLIQKLNPKSVHEIISR